MQWYEVIIIFFILTLYRSVLSVLKRSVYIMPGIGFILIPRTRWYKNGVEDPIYCEHSNQTTVVAHMNVGIEQTVFLWKQRGLTIVAHFAIFVLHSM